MALRTVLVTPEWSLERAGQRARVTCDIALVQDDDDYGFYELRIALNGDRVFTNVHDSHEAVMNEADAMFREFVSDGWRNAMPVERDVSSRRC